MEKNRDSSAKQSQSLLFGVLILLAGCSGSLGQDWHSKVGWKAEDYFDDPQVIALCKAIEANDLDEIDRLVTAGANVNAKGKGNMTPLLWAYPDNKLERFTKLLELGADPNVVVTSGFNSRGGIDSGQSVTELAATTSFPNYFKAVMKHGGNPHLINKETGETLVHAIIASPARDKKERIQLLLDKDVDLDHISDLHDTAVMRAVGWGGQYDIALMLLDAGADPMVYMPDSNKKLIHVVMKEEQRVQRSTSERMKADYDKLVQWLVDLGESPEKAREDNQRWMERARVNPTSKVKKLREKEVAERIAREKAEKEKEVQEKNDDD